MIRNNNNNNFSSTRNSITVILTTTTAMMMMTMFLISQQGFLVQGFSSSSLRTAAVRSTSFSLRMMSSSSSLSMMSSSIGESKKKGKLLVLGGTGFLGQTICKRAILEGYSVTSLSRRGLPPPSSSSSSSSSIPTSSSSSSSSTSSSLSSQSIDYRKGDARNIQSVQNILSEGGYVGVIHCIGLLFDDSSGIGSLNYFVSGSGSVPDENSTYDSITRQSAFNAIDATLEYVKQTTTNNSNNIKKGNFPFVFISAAEAGWPEMTPGGPQIEQFLAPDWLKRYLTAKRAVEQRLLSSVSNNNNNNNNITTDEYLRPIIPRPSLIYSLDRPASYVPVGAFFIGNKLGLPFVDRPVTVQSLANAIVRSISRESVRGILRYPEIDELNQ